MMKYVELYTAKIKTQKNQCGLNLGVTNAILGGRLVEFLPSIRIDLKI